MDDLNLELKKRDLFHFFPGLLQVADENRLLYDSFAPDQADDLALFRSIKRDGIREPLHISQDGVVLSGHRRLACARLLELPTIPCIVHNEITWADMTCDDRLSILAAFNRQREKSHAERLREAMLEVDPDAAHERLRRDRVTRNQNVVEGNVILGARRKRARITTRGFLEAAKRVIESERDYWPLTVRRVHYLLLNDPPLRHDKKPDSVYRNDSESYRALTGLLTRARLVGEIPHESIDDETRPILTPYTWQNPADFITAETMQFLKYYSRDLLRGQTNHVEILVEKNAIRKHVERVAVEYGIPCTTTRGYSSLPPRWKMVQRFCGSGKSHLVLLVLSDFDPDGEEIAASFSRSIRDDFGLEEVVAHKVALSGKDVRDYGLPADMTAKTTSANYEKFVAKHGIHVAELDAAPVTLLQEKLRDAIEGFLDMDLFRAEIVKEKEDAVFITATKKLVMTAIQQQDVK